MTNGYWYNFKVPTILVNKTLQDLLTYYQQSRKNCYLLLHNKELMVNNESQKVEYILKENDTINLFVSTPGIDFPTCSQSCEVVYQDDIILIVHKPTGIIIHDDTTNNTLANMVATYYQQNQMSIPVRYIHRLDKDTSGLVLFVKIAFFQPYFDYLLMNKAIQRKYLAIVVNQLPVGKEQVIDKPIGRDRHNSKKYLVSNSGKPATTKIKCLASKGRYSLVECELLTGRTHQIRVHLNSIHHPIINDELYGQKASEFKQMGLWAYSLSYPDPISGESITINDFPNPEFEYFKKNE